MVTLATLASEAGAAYSNMLVKVCNVPVSKESEWSEFYRISEGEEFMDFPDELENAPIDEYTMQAEKIQLANGQIIDLTAIYLDGGFNNPKEVTVKTPRGYDMQAYTDVDLSQPNTEWDSHIWICDAYGNILNPNALYAGDKVYFTLDDGYGVGYNAYLLPVVAVFSNATGELIADTYTNFQMGVTFLGYSRDRLFSFDMPDEDVVIRVYMMNAYTLTVYNNNMTQVFENVTLYFGSVNTMGIPESWLDNSYMTAGSVATGEAINMPYTLTANTTLTSVYQHGDEKYGRVFYQDETMTNLVIERPSVVLSDVTLTLGDLTSTNAADFVIEEGGSVDILSTDMSDNRLATVRKSIVGYGDDINVKNGWYLISTPFCEEIDPASVTNMIPNTADNYDLYTFSQSNNMAEWRNYKAQGSNVMLKPMEGQLYANKDNVELSMAGNLMAAPREITSGPAISLSYTAGNQFAGWNLVGNPFLVEAYMKNVQNYYRLQDVLEGGVWTSKLIAETGTTPLDPMQGVFVQTDQTRWLEMVKEQPVTNNNQGLLDITVSQSTERGNSTLDRALVRFGEGGMLGKFSFRDGGTQLYIPQGSKDYAVVSTAMQGEVPVNFKASRSGSYTISVEATNAEMEYLHLIDNLTGADVDLLVEPSYTFESHTTDYASRFRLVFSSVSDDADDDNATFAYYNGSEWVIANIGHATLQVVDVMGRILNSETIDGNATARINGTPGVYMMRLINGEKVMVQKVVVR